MPRDDVTIRIGAKDKATAVLKRVRRGLNSIRIGSTGVAIAGAGIAAGFAKAVQTFSSFDAAMAKVGAVSGASAAQLDQLRERAKLLGSSTKFSATEAAEGMQKLAMAGFNTKEILDGIGPTLSLAAAGAVELGEAADIASDVSAAFGLTAAEISKVADVMAVAATSANTSVTMMGESFKFVAPVAKAAGQSIEETTVAMGLLGNAGVKASQAGTDLKNLLVNLVKSEDALVGMGVAIRDAQGEFRPLMDVMGDFGKATENMAGPERLSAAVEIFGKISAKSALILSDVATPAVDEFRKTIREAEGEANRVAAAMQDSLGGAGIKIKSAFEGVQIALIEGFKEPLTEIADELAKSLQGVSQWADQNQEKLADVAKSFKSAGGAIMTTLKGVATVLGVVTVGVTKLHDKIKELAPEVGEDIGNAIGGGGPEGKRFGFTVARKGLSTNAQLTKSVNRSGTVRFGGFGTVTSSAVGIANDMNSGGTGLTIPANAMELAEAQKKQIREQEKGTDVLKTIATNTRRLAEVKSDTLQLEIVE